MIYFKVDNTDKRIAKANQEEEMTYNQTLELETNRQKKLIDGLMEFKIKDDKIKKNRTEDKLEEKVKNNFNGKNISRIRDVRIQL